jgi:hypothetical protein
MSTKEWKRKNYNRKIKVSESVIAQIRKGNKASNIKKANTAGASKGFREGVRRFYGKDTVKPWPATAAAPAKKAVAKKSAAETRATKASADRKPSTMTMKERAGAVGTGKRKIPPLSTVQNSRPEGSGSTSAAAKAVLGVSAAAYARNRFRQGMAARSAAKKIIMEEAAKSATKPKVDQAAFYRRHASRMQRAFDKGLITKVELQEANDMLATARRAQASRKSAEAAKRAAEGRARSSVPRQGAANKMRSQGARIDSGRQAGDRKRA